MRTASDVMTTELITAAETDTLEAALSVFESRGIRHLPVLRGERLVGILSQRDLLQCWPHKGEPGADRICVREAMTRQVLSVREHSPLRQVMELVLKEQIGAVPVIDARGRLVGIITRSDLVRFAKARVDDEELRELAAEYEP